MIYLFLAHGFEETEAVATIDLLRRAGMKVQIVSTSGEAAVEGAHGITLMADSNYPTTRFDKARALILPGGMPGTANLWEFSPLRALLKEAHRQGTLIAAICAAPLILGRLGLLDGLTATCFPGFEDELIGATISPDTTCQSGNIITSVGVQSVNEFALTIIRNLQGKNAANKVEQEIYVK